jgi:hypothetical protein
VLKERLASALQSENVWRERSEGLTEFVGQKQVALLVRVPHTCSRIHFSSLAHSLLLTRIFALRTLRSPGDMVAANICAPLLPSFEEEPQGLPRRPCPTQARHETPRPTPL